MQIKKVFLLIVYELIKKEDVFIIFLQISRYVVYMQITMSFKHHLLIERWHEYASRFKHMLVIFEVDLMKTVPHICLRMGIN